jgi:hypothetical protein
MAGGSIRLAGAVVAAGLLAIAGAAVAIALSSIPGAKPAVFTVVALAVPVFAVVAAVHGVCRLPPCTQDKQSDVMQPDFSRLR